MSHCSRTVCVALAAALTASVASVPATAAEPEPWLQVLDISFPTLPTAQVTDTFDACRSGCSRGHQASDLIGEKMWPLFATVDGVVCRIDDGEEDSYGRHLTICGDDGNQYRYLHLNNDRPGTDDGEATLEHVYAPGIRHGVRVARGQFVAYMGDSGNAEETVDHLHLDIFVPGVENPYGEERINPYPSLMAALARGDVPDGTAGRTESARRLAGTDRMRTAVAMSQEMYRQADTVVLASADTPQDALVAGPLAAALGGPVLTTPVSHLDDAVADEIRRLEAQTVVVVGGAVPDAEEIQVLLGADGTVERIRGDDVFATAAMVAERVWDAGDPSEPRRAIVALGRAAREDQAWPDALSSSWYGAVRGMPVLLTDQAGLPDVASAALDAVEEVWIAGGPQAVSAVQAEEIAEITGTRATRFAGTDRYETAALVAQDLIERRLADPATVVVATGHNWPDAIAAAPAVARRGAALLLVHGRVGGSEQAQEAFLRLSSRVTRIVAVGGPEAITDAVLATVAFWAV